VTVYRVLLERGAEKDLSRLSSEIHDRVIAAKRTHPIAFASPRALLEARMIAEMDKARRPRRRTHQNGVAHRRKAVAG